MLHVQKKEKIEYVRGGRMIKIPCLEHYSAVFVQFTDEADALFSRGDHASATDVLMKATLYNKNADRH